MTMMLAVCVVLLIAGLALVFLEMFVPSAGVLGFLSAGCIVFAVALAYYYEGPVVGTIFLGVGALLTPLAIAAALHWYPSTPLGRLVMPLPPTPEEVLPLEEITGQLRRLKGQVGRAKTPLLPGGTVKIEGKIYSALSEGEPIETGELVLIARIDGTRLIVRRLEEAHLATPDAPSANPSPVGDVLSQPIEALGIESLEDPLG